MHYYLCNTHIQNRIPFSGAPVIHVSPSNMCEDCS